MRTSPNNTRLQAASPIIALLTIVAALPAVAQQEVSSPNPIRTNGNGVLGVNVVTRSIDHKEIDVVSGPQGSPSSIALSRRLGGGLSYGPSMGKLGEMHFFEHNYRLFATILQTDNLASNYAEITLFGQTYLMYSVSNSATLTNTFRDLDGSIFREIGNMPIGSKSFEFISHDGVRAVFRQSHSYMTGTIDGVYADYVDFPDGRFIDFKYETVRPPLEWAHGNRPDTISRLSEIVNSHGYGIRFAYVDQTPGGARDIDKITIASTTPFFRTCLSISSCVEKSGPPTTYTYGGSFNGFGQKVLHLATVSKGDGTQSKYTHDIPREGYVTTSRGVSSVPDYSYSTSMRGVGDEEYGPVTHSVQDARGNLTTFEPTAYLSGSIITAPDGGAAIYNALYDPRYPWWQYNDPVILSSVDENGRETHFSYFNSIKIKSIISPEGDIVRLRRDPRGNVTEQRRLSKPSQNTLDLVSSFAYPTCTEMNRRFCNKPSYTVDERGGRTDYQYHQPSGELELIVYPPDLTGVRRSVRYQFATFVPADAHNVASDLNAALVWMKTAEEECRSSAVTGAEGSFYFACSAGDLIRTEFIYEPSTPSRPSRHLLVGKRMVADGKVSLACFSNDEWGNLLTETSPAAQLSTCPGS